MASRSDGPVGREPEQTMQRRDAVEQAKQWLLQRGVALPADGAYLDDREQAGHEHEGTRPSRKRTQPDQQVLGTEHGSSYTDAAAWVSRDPSSPAARAVEADEPEADPRALARTIVLRRLAARARTRAELEKALDAKQVPAEAAREVLDRMQSVGLIDDPGFARDWVESRQQRRHLSKSALRRELRAKGIDREEVEGALEAVGSDDELSAARSLAAKKVSTLAGLDRQVQYRRLAGMLGRRQFSPDVIRRVVEEALDAGV